MTKAPNRTRPLDRDGDGRDGGSLPGNQTAPMGQGDAAPEWTRVDADILEDLQLMDEGWSGTVESLTLAQVKEWSDDQAREAQAYAAAIVGLTPERRPPAPDFLQPFLVSKPADPADGQAAPSSSDVASPSDDAPEPSDTEAVAAASEGSGDDASVEAHTDDDADADTFTEEIAAGATPVVEQEGETATTAAQAATVIDPADPLVSVDTPTAPIAVRLGELQTLTNSRRLYRSAEGYSATYAAPYIETATVEGWIAAGLAEDIPTGGNQGAVRATAHARAMAADLRQQQAAA